MEGISFALFVASGVLALLLLGLLIYESIKENKIRITTKAVIAIAITSIITLLMYIIILYMRKYVYTWDYKTYYSEQLAILSIFSRSFLQGISTIIKTIYFYDYGCFLLSFTSLIFYFTNHTGNAFVITYAVVTIIPMIIIYYSIISKLIQKYELKNKNMIITLGLMLTVAFPLLHAASIMGQPDFMGIIFIGLIILLTMDYDFEKADVKRYILIFISTLCLIITRRWYIYWVVSYYICYAIILCIKNLVNKDYRKLKSTIKNLLIFGISSIIIMAIILAPMIIRIVKENFFSSYSAWKIGGLPYEIMVQFRKIGGIYFTFMVIGIIYGIKSKKFRWITIQMFLTGISALVLFTRLQNMGNHQSLILVPTYIYLCLIFIIAISQMDNKWPRRILEGLTIISFATTLFGTLTENKYFYNNYLYTDISIKPNKREDYETIGEIDKFILENCDLESKVYINAATNMYCADTFTLYMFPDVSLQSIINQERSINSVHGFPIEIFGAKYIFVSNVDLESTGAQKGTIIKKVNESIKENDQMREIWKLVKEFKMTDKVTFYAYERIKEFDQEEANYWIELFQEESKEYPHLFSERIKLYTEVMSNKAK